MKAVGGLTLGSRSRLSPTDANVWDVPPKRLGGYSHTDMQSHLRTSYPVLVHLHGSKEINPPPSASCKMIFGGRLSIWPFPEKSVGQQCTMNIRGTQCWEARGPACDAMNELYPHIKQLLENNQELLEQGVEKPRIIGFNLWMEGKSPGASQPVIVFSSKSWRQRTRAKELLKQSDLLHDYPGIKIKTLDRMPAIYRTQGQEQEQGRISPNPQYALAVSKDPHVYLHRDYDHHIDCGAPISFGKIRPATLAGFVSVGGICYGLTAQHGRFKPQEPLGPVARSDEILAFDEDSDEGDYR
jgi:hypothetical protein